MVAFFFRYEGYARSIVYRFFSGLRSCFPASCSNNPHLTLCPLCLFRVATQLLRNTYLGTSDQVRVFFTNQLPLSFFFWSGGILTAANPFVAEQAASLPFGKIKSPKITQVFDLLSTTIPTHSRFHFQGSRFPVDSVGHRYHLTLPQLPPSRFAGCLTFFFSLPPIVLSLRHEVT